MRIVEIEVEQLFGTFDHRIPLKISDRITLIHGPNGFGKTIILEMVYDLFNGHYATLRRIPFRQLVVRFNNGARVAVRKHDLSDHELTVTSHGGDPGAEGELKLPALRSAGMARILAREIPHLDRFGRDSWLDQSTDRVLTTEQALDIYRDQLPGSKRDPAWLQEIRQSVRVEMIREQRLSVMRIRKNLRRWREHAMVPAIEEYSTALADILQHKLAESATLSQSLDRTFPARLLERISAKGPSENELSAKLAELERKREQLRDAGLLDEQEEMPLLPTERLGEETRDVLAVYVEDAEKKLGIFEDLARKIELFQAIINSRFLYKRLAISRRHGLVFTTSGGEPLALSALSSGEQQELVLLYELLFRLEPDSLVLIDEPELSLHVAWQKKFLEDLEEITELTSFDVLIATHSPQIIHKRWDLTVELASPRVEAEVEAASLP